jgi:hypothetical protein
MVSSGRAVKLLLAGVDAARGCIHPLLERSGRFVVILTCECTLFMNLISLELICPIIAPQGAMMGGVHSYQFFCYCAR